MPTNKITIALCILLLNACNSKHQEAENHFQKGKELFEQGEFDKAYLELKSSGVNDINAETYFFLALLEEKRQNFRAMREDLQKTIELDSGNLAARLKLSKVDLLFGDTNKALEQVEIILKEKQFDSDALALKAKIFIKQGKIAEADSIIDKVLANSPNHIDAMSLKAAEYYNRNEIEQALAVADEAIKKDSKNIDLRLFRINIYAQLNNSKGMEEDFKDLISFYPDEDNFTLNLASVYAFTGKQHEAEQLLRQSVDKFPNKLQAKLVLLDFLLAKAKDRLVSEYEFFLTSNKTPPIQYLQLASWMLANGYVEQAENGFSKVVASENDTRRLSFIDSVLVSLKKLTGVYKESALSLAAQTKLAEIALTKKQFEVVTKSVDHILHSNSDFIEANLLKARLYLAENKPDDAIETLNKAIWIKNNSDEAYFWLGQAYSYKKDLKQAFANYKQALEINPANLGAFFPIYDSFLKANQKEVAQQYLDKALKLRPFQDSFLNAKAELAMQEKKWNQAQEIMARLALFSKNQAALYYLQANILQGKQRYAEAITIYEGLLKEFPENLESMISIVRCYDLLKSHDKAIAFLEAQHSVYPENLTVVGLLGNLYIQDNAFSKAKELYVNQIEKMPKAAQVYLGLAKVEAILHKDLDWAKRVYLQGLEQKPDDPILVYALAGLYQQMGDIGNARKTYEKLLELQPGNDLAINNLAVLLVNTGVAEDAAKARAMAEKFKNDENPSFQDTYAWALVKTGHQAEAIKLLESIILKEPKSPEFRYHLGVAHYKAGATAIAIAELKKALNLSETQHRDFSEKNDAKKILLELEQPRQKS